MQLDELVVSQDSCFFTMDRVRGKTFADYVRSLVGDGAERAWTAPAIASLERVVGQVVAGLSALHDAGVIHRDIERKPRWSLERARLLRRARADARRIAREDVAWAPALAATLEAGLAVAAGDEARAASHLARAGEGFRSLEMKLHAAAVDLERGRLIGGESGRILRSRAGAWMHAESVKDPERLAAMLVPAVRDR